MFTILCILHLKSGTKLRTMRYALLYVCGNTEKALRLGGSTSDIDANCEIGDTRRLPSLPARYETSGLAKDNAG